MGVTNLETNHNALIDTIKDTSAEILPKQRKTKKIKSTWSGDPILLELIKVRNSELRKPPTDQTALKMQMDA